MPVNSFMNHKRCLASRTASCHLGVCAMEMKVLLVNTAAGRGKCACGETGIVEASHIMELSGIFLKAVTWDGITFSLSETNRPNLSL